MKQIPLAIGPRQQPSFENFVPGANAAALAHLRALQPPAPPVYLWGPGGSGKSHLLQAWAAQCNARGLAVGWFDAASALPWALVPAWSALVLDRCDDLSAEAQHAAFALFIEAATHGVQVLAAGRLPPVDLPLRDDLRTRLAWGHVFALEALGDGQTRAALRRAADQRGILLPDEVVDYLLARFERDLGFLMRVLDRLDAYSLANGRRVTVPLLKQMLADDDAPVRAHA
jgi:DnaA family protein